MISLHFATWFLNIVRVPTSNGVDVDLDVIRFSRPLNPITYTYKNMWAYGNHYQVDEHEGRMMHATYDNGMAYIFKQGSRCSIQDRNIVVANLHYVGVLKEIIAVSERGL